MNVRVRRRHAATHCGFGVPVASVRVRAALAYLANSGLSLRGTMKDGIRSIWRPCRILDLQDGPTGFKLRAQLIRATVSASIPDRSLH